MHGNAMASKFKAMNLSPIIFCFFTLIFFIPGCSYFYKSDHDKLLEEKINKFTIVNSDGKYIDFSEIKESNFNILCFQGPYITQDEFERLIGRKVPNFDVPQYDSSMIWHFFGKGGEHKWIVVNNIKSDGALKKAPCMDLEKKRLLVVCKENCLYKVEDY